MDEIAKLKGFIKELFEVSYLGFYGTVENHQRWVKIVTDPEVMQIAEKK